jgi:hypothetical protein
MLVASSLNTALAAGLGITATPYTLAYAEGIIASLQAATFSHVLVTGIAPPSGPLTAGTAVGGIMVITPGPMEAITSVQFSTSPHILTENAAIVTYVGTGLINFAPGTINGACAAGAFVGSGIGGTILGLTGSDALVAVSTALGSVGPLGLPFYNALITYILANANCSYAPGTVVGAYAFPAGGPMTGSAAGGTIA